MVTATAPSTTSHRAPITVKATLHAYRWPVIALVFAGLVTAAAIVAGGQILAFEAGALAMSALCGWQTTRSARKDAREWAALRAEYDKE